MEEIIIQIKSKILIVCICFILIFAIGSAVAASDEDGIDANDTITNNVLTADDESNGGDSLAIEDNQDNMSVLEHQDTDKLKADGVIYISPDGTGDGSSEDNPTTWSTAWGNVASGGTIGFLPGTYTNIKNQNINKQITLKGIGDGVVLDAENNGRFFTITANSFVIDNIKFINGKVTGNEGGAIYFSSQVNSLTMSNCCFSSNTANRGGAIYFNTHCYNFNMSNCNFTDNKANTHGGAINQASTDNIKAENFYWNNLNFINNYGSGAGGSVLLRQTKNFNLENSSFINSSCDVSQSWSGGGAFFFNSGEDFKFNKVNFTNCSTLSRGGAIFIYQSNMKNLEMNNMNFINCSATQYGGALYFIGNTNNFDLNNSIFINCKAVQGGDTYFNSPVTDLNVLNCNFTNNTASDYGGNFMFRTSISSLSVRDCNFVNSTAKSADGGSFCFWDGSSATIKDISFVNVNFTKVSAGRNGGAIYFHKVMTSPSFVNVSFVNTRSGGAGGVIFFNGNVNIKSEFKNVSFVNSTATGHGGAVYFAGTLATFDYEGLEFVNTYSGDCGGAVYFKAVPKNLVLDDIVLIDNGAKNYGGAVYINDAVTGLTISNISPISGYASQGGNFYFYSAVSGLNVVNCNFTNSTAGGYGGNFFFRTSISSLSVRDCNFVNSTAKSTNGGSFCFWNSNSATIKDISFENVNFTNVSAGAEGGAIRFNAPTSNINIDKCNFDNCNASNGGSISFNRVNNAMNGFLINNTNFTNIHATSGSGGAIHFYSASTSYVSHNIRIFNSIFNNVSSTSTGGAIYLDYVYDVKMDNLTFNDVKINGDASGGGIYIHYYCSSAYTESNRVYLNNMDFSNIEVGNNGAGIYLERYSSNRFNLENVMENMTFINCTAKGTGGGAAIYFNTPVDTLTMNNIKCDNLVSNGNGGAFSFVSSAKNIIVKESSFNDISANYGGVIYFYGGVDDGLNGFTMNSVNVTNVDAKGSGGVVYFNGYSGNSYEKRRGHNIRIYDNTFENIAAGISGGVFYFYSAYDLVIKNNSFVDIDAKSDGGAIYIYYSAYSDPTAADKVVILNNMNFTNIKAGSNGGAIHLTGTYNLDKTMENMTFINCSAYNGGGIYFNFAINEFNFNNVEFINCTATKYAAGAFFNGKVTTFSANKIYALNNHVGDDGGVFRFNSGFSIGNFTEIISINNNAIPDASSTVDIVRGCFGSFMVMESSIDKIFMSDSQFINSKCQYGGGVLYINNMNPGGQGIFDNLSFINSTADNYGGVLFVDSNAYGLTFNNVNFTNSHGGVDGGVVYIEGAANGLTLNNTMIVNSSSGNNGGVVYIGGAANGLTLNNTMIVNSSSGNNGGIIYLASTSNNKDIIINNTLFENYKTTVSGSALYLASSNDLTINNVNFTQDTIPKTTGNGGIIYMGSSSKINVTNVNFAGTYIVPTNSKGGVMYIASTTGDVYLTNVTFNDNTLAGSNSQGGVLYIGNTKNVIFTNVNVTNVDASQVESNGGAIYLAGTLTSYTLNNTNFINVSSNFGGAIYVSSETKLYVFDTNFENVSSTRGAVYFNNKFTDLEIINTNFTDNVASLDAASIYVATAGSANALINNTNFINQESNGNGGAIYFNGVSNSQIFNSNFTNGHSDKGAALYINGGSNILIINATFINNIAEEEGGAIYWDGTYGKVIESDFINNTAQSENLGGGAIYATSKANYLNINQTDFKGNKASYGGALYIESDDGIVYECTFRDNAVQIDGGAIYLSNNCERFNIEESYFKNNTASNNGGAVYVSGKSNRVINSTFVENHAKDGAGVYVYVNYQHKIINSTFLRNVAIEDGGGVYFCRGIDTGEHFVDWNLFRNGIKDSDGRVTWSQTPGNEETAYVLKCYFEDNIDYLIKVKAIDSGSLVGVIEVTVPRGANKGYAPETNVEMIITVIDENGTIIHTETVERVRDGEAKVTIDGLDMGKFTVNVTFKDKNHLLKYNSTILEIHQIKGDFEILQELIDKAIQNHDSVLILDRSYKFTFDKNGNAIDYSQVNITADYPFKIIGQDLITIDAAGQCRIFLVNSSNVTLENIIFANGDANGRFGDGNLNGGAIHWNAENGTLNNCIFEKNHADYGGGIYFNSTSSDCKINDCTFTENNADYDGGAIDCNAAKMGLYNTLFESNEADYGAALCRESDATGGHGKNNIFIANHAYKSGAALGWINSSSISIDTYFFYNNTADVSGGAIYVGNGSQECQIINCEFEGNEVLNDTNGRGGAIDWYATEGLVLNSTFTKNNAFEGGAIFIENIANNINITSTDFRGNEAIENGGAIYLLASSATLNQTNFYDNTADNGGAIYVGGQGSTNSIYSSTFVGNNATEGVGGAIDWVASKGIIADSTFTRNNADYGGAVYMGGGSTQSAITNVVFDGNIAKYNGGAIDWDATEGNLTNTVFKNNVADYGAALCRESGATRGFGKNNTFIANHARISGAALGWMGSVGISINNYSFIDNTAGVSGAAIYINENSHNCTIFNSTFNGNHIIEMTEGNNGGAIMSLASNTTINMSSFDNNRAYSGGAIYVNSDSGHTNILNSNFTNNRAIEEGGAIGLKESEVNVNESYFKGNSAHNGGALFVGGTGHNNVYRSNFTDNHAYEGYGGAINWVASSGYIFESRFNENTADYGGALYLAGDSRESRISKVVFEKNIAVFNGGAIDANTGRINLTHTEFVSNEANYGAALCREVNASGGFGDNNTFKSNHARIGGAALGWMGAVGISINNYKFIDNTADVYGGAIYVSPESHNCTIDNSVFRGNHITNETGGYGGAIYCAADNMTVLNSNFTTSQAFYGGAIYVNGNGYINIANANFTLNTAERDGGAIYWKGGNGGIIENSIFSYNAGFENGGAIFILNDTNGTIKNSTFDNNQAPGRHNPERIEYGNGGAIALVNTDEFTISNLTFDNNYANVNGGAIYGNNSSSSDLFNLTFNNNEARTGGSIAWINSEGLNITLNNYKTSTSHDNGGAIFINGTDVIIKDSEFDTTISDYGQAGAIYANGNLTIINATFANYKSSDDEASAILFDGGNSTMVNSTLSGINAVTISEEAIVYLTMNNITESSTGDYSVLNLGDLYLNKNNFDNVIINGGIIWTQTYTVVLNGENVTVASGDNVRLNASIVDDNNNIIVSSSFKFHDQTTGKYINSSYIGKHNFGTYEKVKQGIYIINATDSGLNKNNVTVGRLIVKDKTNVNITVNQTNEGEIVVIKVTLSDKGNYDYKGNVTFNVNGKVETAFVENGIANFTLYNLTEGIYTVTATYNGDDCHFNATNTTFFIVKLRQTNITVTVASIIIGQNTTAIATTNGNGTITFIFNGKSYTVKIENGTAKLQLNATDLPTAREYSITASYNGNDYFNKSINSTTFNVYKHNTTISAEPTEVIRVFENEIINVTVNENATGAVKVVINNTEYLINLNNGTAQFNISGLVKGKYANITVTYVGDDYFNGNSTNVSFEVIPTDDYNITVEAENIKYGENATIIVTLPILASGNVTIYVDNEKYENVAIKNGIVTLNTTQYLEAGNHTVNVTYVGDGNYAAKDKNGTVFNVTPTDNWTLNFTVEAHKYGEDTIFNVTLPGNVLNETVIINIDGKTHTVELNQGKGSLVLNNLTAGFYEATATYSGDDRYQFKTNSTKFLIEQSTPTIIIKVDPIKVDQNATINITMPENVTGNITIHVGDKKFNRIIESHNVILNVSGLAYGNHTVVVYYEGDVNYTKSSNSTNLTVNKWNSQVNVTISNATYHVGDSFIIKLTNNTVANVTINGKVYTLNSDGSVNVNTADLNAGNYTVTATIKETYKYFANTSTVKFSIIKYDSKVNVTINQTGIIYVGDNFTIKVTNNTVAIVTINGKEYSVENETVKIDTTKLKAGTYTVTAITPENKKYNSNMSSIQFNITKHNSIVNITANDTYVIGSEFNITVGNNSAVKVTVNGENVTVNADGTLNVNSKELTAGRYVVIATIYENDYYFGNSTTAIFDVIKKNSTVIVEIIPNNGTFFVGSDFIINVTNNTAAKVTINGKEYVILANGNVDIDTAKLLAGSYNVTVTVPENEYYYGNSSSVNFIVVKQKSNVTVDVYKTYVIGSDFNITVTNSSAVNVTVNGVVYPVVKGKVVIDTTNLTAGKYVVIATIYENDKFYGNTTTATFEIIKKNSTIRVEVIPANGTFFVGSEFVINVTNNTVAKVTINGKEYAVKANGNVDIDTTKLLAGNYTVVVTVPENRDYYANSTNVSFVIDKQKSNVTVDVYKTYVIGSDFNITVTNSSAVKVTVNGVVYPVVDGRVVIDTTNLTAGKYVVIATIYENDFYYGNTTTKTFEIIKKNSTVAVEIIPANGTFFVGSEFVINVTNNTVAKVTINGKEYAVKANGNVDIDTTKLLAGNYTVVVTVPENRDYYANSTNVSFVIDKQKSNVTVDVYKTYVIGSDFNITVTNSSIVKVTVNGENVTVNADGTLNINSKELSAGKYVVIATIYENDFYYGNTTTETFEIIKMNSTVAVEIIPANGTFFVGSGFVINVTNNTVAKVTINGKEYAVKVNGNVDIDTTKLLAGSYNVTVTVPENDYYYGNSSSVNFTVVKQKSNVTVDVGKTYVIGSDFNITVTNSSAVNVTVNGDSYPVVNGKVVIDTAELSAGKYVVIATIYENDFYYGNTTTETFEIIKKNSTVGVEIIPANGTFFVGSDFIIHVTNSTAAKVTINGKEYAIKTNGNVDIDTTKLLAGSYNVTVTVPENDYYYGNSSSVNFTVVKQKSNVAVDVGKTYVIGSDFNITVTNSSAVNVTVNGDSYPVVNGKVVIDTAELSAGKYVVIATIYENDFYYGNTTTETFEIIKKNSTVGVEIIPANGTFFVGSDFIIHVTNSTAAKVTINGKEYAIKANGNVDIDTTKLLAGNYTVIVTVPENDYYYGNETNAAFTIIKYESKVNVTVGESFVYGTSFNITVENSTAVNVTINGKQVNVKADGTLDIDSTTMAATHYVVIATIYENDKYLGNVDTKEFDITKLDSSVNITITPNTTHVYGDEFIIKVENNTNVTVTINGDKYNLTSEGNVIVDTTKLPAGDYTVIASIPENAKYLPNSSTVKFSIIKLPSSVNITVGDSYIYGSEFNITVVNNTAVNVTINGKPVKVNADGTLDIDSTTMAATHYVVIATIYENAKYYGNVSTKEFNITKLASSVNITIEPNTTHVYGDTFVIKVENSTNAIVTINGDEYAILPDGTVNVTTSTLAAGDYTVIASIPENAKYLPNSSTVKFSIIKLPSSVNITVGDSYIYGSEFNITVENNTAVNVTINGKPVKVNADGTLDIDSTTMAATHYVVIATIYENAKYYGSVATREFNITKLQSHVNITIDPDTTHVFGDKFTIRVNNDTAAVVTINGEKYDLTDGVVDVDTSKLPAGDYTVIASIPENAKYLPNSSTLKFTIIKLPSSVNITIDPNATHYVGDKITIKVENNTVASVTIDGVEYKILSDGTVDVDTSNFAAGTHTVTADIAENDKYYANSTTLSFNVTKLSSNVKVSTKDTFIYGETVCIMVEVPSEQTGFVSVIVNGKNNTAKISNGTAIVNITGLNVKQYSVNVEYLGDDKYFTSKNDTMFEVIKSDLNASVIAQNVTTKDPASFIVNVPEDFKGLVNITVDNKTYSGDANSIIKMDKLTAGNKTAHVVFYDDPNYKDLEFDTSFKVQNITEAFNITSIKSENMTRGWNSLFDYQATFLKSDGSALANTEVQFVVNGKTYTAKTNDAGVAQLTNAKLDVGEYNITSINPVTGESVVNKVTIVKRIIENKDLTMDFASGKSYKVRVIGDDGKPVGAGEIIDIYANTIHYVAKTDKNGYAKLKINLNPKKYTIKCEYKTFKTTNKLVVKQTLKLVKKTVKVKKGNKLVLKAKLKWSNGKAIKGKKIVFKFKGKKYKAKTNSKGIAKVTIKKKVTKKLKKGKKYKYTATYKTNTVKGKVKVKK